jgi:hypothetical protein
VIDPSRVTKRKRTLQRGPAGAKKSKSGEGASVAAPPPLASADVPLPSEQSKEGEFGSFVELMGALPSDPRPPSSQEAGLEMIAELQDGGELQICSPGGSPPVRTSYKQVVSDEEDLRELDPEEAQKQSAFGGASSSATPRTEGDGSSFFVPGVTLPPLGEGMLFNARRAGPGQLADEYGYHISKVSAPYMPPFHHMFPPRALYQLFSLAGHLSLLLHPSRSKGGDQLFSSLCRAGEVPERPQRAADKL